jgi:predicted nucleotidyltransferase component of viral defense system
LKTITDEQARLINDARAEGIVALSAAVLEKDILVTEALRAIAARSDDGVALTFTGGTCLSKAHGLLERMSEDVDFRVVPADLATLSRSAQRARLREVHQSLLETLRAADFEVRDEDVQVRNEYHKFSYELRYRSAYEPDVSLRPVVLVEFTAIQPRMPTAALEMRPLIDRLTGRKTAEEVAFACIAVEETYCEKIVSYLRRSAEHLAKREHSQYEERLARHIYDVHCIEREHFGTRGQARPTSQLISDLIAAEARQFGSRLQGFDSDPVGVMQSTLQAISAHTEFKEHYDRFAADLIYGDTPPSFDTAFSTFRSAAEKMFAAYSHR